MRISLTSRLSLAAAALLAIFGAAHALRGWSLPTESARPVQRLSEMPMSFDKWKGEDVDLDPRVVKAIGAEMTVNRRYKNRASAIDLHSDVFLHYGVRDTPHPPEMCYGGAGFAVTNSETLQIADSGQGGHAARLLTLDRDGARVYCLYWYQAGDVTFLDMDGQRRWFQALRGRTIWPPMIKVMLATTARSPDEAATSLTALANLVYPWTRDFH